MYHLSHGVLNCGVWRASLLLGTGFFHKQETPANHTELFRFPLGCRPTTGTKTPKYKGAFSFREVGERNLAPPLEKACLVSEVQPCKALIRPIPSRQVRVALGLLALRYS